MRKFNFIFWLFTLLISIFSLPLFIFDDRFHLTYYFLIVIVLFGVNIFLKRADKALIKSINQIYIFECDPLKYFHKYQAYLKKCFVSKNALIMLKNTEALVNLDAGNITHAKTILDTLVDQEPTFNNLTKFWYYKAWIHYLEEQNEIKKMEVLINKQKELLNFLPPSVRPQFEANYNSLVARYYVKNGIYLDNAEMFYSDILRGNYPKINIVTSVFYLGVISFKQGKYELAAERFRSVKRSANKLYISEKAEKYLDLIEQKTALLNNE